MKPSCSIFIPAYNAEKTISSILMRITHETWEHISKIVVIDDGSQDNTVSIITQLKDKFTKLELLSFDINQGYGKAVSKGMELCLKSDCDYIVCLHADGQYPPEKIDEFLYHMQNNKIDILQGSRHKAGTALEGGMPLYKYLAGKMLVWLENQIFGLKMTDYHSGFIVYSRNALSKIPFQYMSNSFDFDLEIIAMANKRNLVISELAIPTCYGDEKSYLNPVIYGLRILKILFKYKAGYYD